MRSEDGDDNTGSYDPRNRTLQPSSIEATPHHNAFIPFTSFTPTFQQRRHDDYIPNPDEYCPCTECMLMERYNDEPIIQVPSRVENAKTTLDLCELFEDREGFAMAFQELMAATLEEMEQSREMENVPEGSGHEDSSI